MLAPDFEKGNHVTHRPSTCAGIVAVEHGATPNWAFLRDFPAEHRVVVCQTADESPLCFARRVARAIGKAADAGCEVAAAALFASPRHGPETTALRAHLALTLLRTIDHCRTLMLAGASEQPEYRHDMLALAGALTAFDTAPPSDERVLRVCFDQQGEPSARSLDSARAPANDARPVAASASG